MSPYSLKKFYVEIFSHLSEEIVFGQDDVLPFQLSCCQKNQLRSSLQELTINCRRKFFGTQVNFHIIELEVVCVLFQNRDSQGGTLFSLRKFYIVIFSSSLRSNFIELFRQCRICSFVEYLLCFVLNFIRALLHAVHYIIDLTEACKRKLFENNSQFI